jgi:SAM-dependent methyltransferase
MSDARHAHWEARFAAPDYVYGTAPSNFLIRHRSLLPTRGGALAVADGEGRNGVYLAECGLDVTSLDFSASAQAKARALAAERGVALTLETADLLAWTWPEARFDVVAAIFCQFLAPAERARVFAAIRRALKPGGLLLLHGYTPDQLRHGTGGPQEVEYLYTPELLRAAFGDFDALSIRAYERVLSEGRQHSGLSALIDLTGRKP